MSTAITTRHTTVSNPAASVPAPAGAFTLPHSQHVASQGHYFHGIAAVLEDAVLLMLVVFLVPVVILLVGAPVALGIRAIHEIVGLFSW